MDHLPGRDLPSCWVLHADEKNHSLWWQTQHLKILPVPQILLFSLLKAQQQEAGLSGSNLHAGAASHTGGAPSTTALAPRFQDTQALCPGCAVHHEGTKLLQASAWQGLGSSRAPPGSRKASAHLLFTLNEFLPSSAPLPKARSVGSCEQISNSLVKTVSPRKEGCKTLLPTKKSLRLNFQQLDTLSWRNQQLSSTSCISNRGQAQFFPLNKKHPSYTGAFLALHSLSSAQAAQHLSKDD